MADDNIYKIFCDESCYLQHDGADIMVLGAIHCSAQKSLQFTKHIKWLRHQHNYHNELKWTKLIQKQWPFYKALIDAFIQDDEISFKATVVQHKKTLDHERYNGGSHSTFYYKMFYYTVRDFLNDGKEYRIYLDYVDTSSGQKSSKLCEILQQKQKNGTTIKSFIVQSYESQLIQLCDLLIGAIAYKNRAELAHSSMLKNQIVSYLESVLGYELDYTTPPWQKKFNIFRFAPGGL